MRVWAALSLDAKVVGALAVGNWLLLFANHTVVQVARDAPLWQLFPGLWGAAWLLGCGLLGVGYPLRDHRFGPRFGTRQRILHLAAIVALFVVVPTVAAIVLRETGKPYTYVHDGAIMVEEAARKLVAGQDPYVADYLDTPLFYWPMINNPALYHLTYFPALFLATVPFVVAFDRIGLFFDERYLYLPAFLATLAIAPLLIPAKPISARPGDVVRGPARSGPEGAEPSGRRIGASIAHNARPGGGREPSSRADLHGVAGAEVPRDRRPAIDPRADDGEKAAQPGLARPQQLALAALIALNPQLFPFVVEGRNDFFVLLFIFAGIALLQRERRALGVLAIAVAAASKLHAGPLIPFVLAYLVWRDGLLPWRERATRLARATWAGALVMVAAFVPFLLDNFAAFWDDIVAYNAGGAAWSYPVSGMGFSAILRALGVISYPQQDFPFAALQAAAALPLAAWSFQRLRRDPSIATLLTGYAVTLLAFLFFGRYFHGNHLGFIVAVASPIPFLRPDLVGALVSRITLRTRAAIPVPATAVIAPVAITSDPEPPTA